MSAARAWLPRACIIVIPHFTIFVVVAETDGGVAVFVIVNEDA